MLEPPAGVRSDPDVVAAFSADASGVGCGVAAGVVSPASVAEVQDVLRYAAASRTPVIPRGAGTGLSGGACAVDGGLVLDLTRMRSILEISAASRLAVVEAGVTTGSVSDAAAPHGLMYAPDPASWRDSTIGGNVATNAGGLRCLRYGVTRQSVLGLEVVLADGRLLSTGGRTVKRSAGYDLTQLFIGSEGTLGVVVGATLRLHSVPPPQRLALLTFSDVAEASSACLALSGPQVPTLLELLDRRTIRALDRFRAAGFGESVGAALFVQGDRGAAFEQQVAAAATRAADVISTDDPVESASLLDIRRAALPALQELGPLLLEDVCVPVSRLPEMLASVEVAADRWGVEIATIAHAGDGNLHPAIVVPPDDEQRAHDAADEIFRAALELGGTVSGEHGIGRLKRRWLAAELSPTAIDVQWAVKSLFDPLGILNPGAVLPARGPV